ncbi:MAG: hypothetical protein HGB36_00665 [Chlorobiaceae bacterium]|nr:hypothetical protein [Chlorobiaceae bacterium]
MTKLPVSLMLTGLFLLPSNAFAALAGRWRCNGGRTRWKAAWKKDDLV